MRKLFNLMLFALTALAVGCGSPALQNALMDANLNSIVRLVFAPGPVTTVLGTEMPTIKVEGRDQSGNVIAVSTGAVELSLGNNPTGAQLLQNGVPVATVSQNANNGVATFSNLRVSAVGQGYTLTARYQVPGSLEILTATSEAFQVLPQMATSVVFLRSTQNLWGENGGTSDTNALDAAFGAGNWTLANFETASATEVFRDNRLVFIDGGDQGALEMLAFLTANSDTIRNFINGGGRVIFNSAPNEGADIATGIGPTINYSDNTSLRQVSVEAAHPIGVACGTNLNFTGNSFGHALVLGENLTPIIKGTAVMAQTLTPVDRVVLAEGRLGTGLFLVGGMTTTNFHSPQPQGNELRANILRYAAGFPLVPLTTVTMQSDPPQTPSSVR